MSERTRKRRGPLSRLAERSRRFWIITALIVVGLLYIASSGPVIYCTIRFNSLQPAHRTAQAIYLPIVYVPIINVPVSDYCDWWTELALQQREVDRIRKLPFRAS